MQASGAGKKGENIIGACMSTAPDVHASEVGRIAWQQLETSIMQHPVIAAHAGGQHRCRDQS